MDTVLPSASALTRNAGSVRHHLKAATQARHVQLDAMVGPMRDADQYRRYVRGIGAFRIYMEAGLDRLRPPASAGQWQPTRLAASLGKDMLALGLASFTPAVMFRPVTPAQVLGACYVLEGSSLGARVLLPRVTALGFGPATGAGHLLEQAHATGWRDFLTCLDDAPACDRDVMTAAACATFDVAVSAMRQACTAALAGATA
ncbi:biliverdin-producing heme oxygenase [Komagataeibacter sp. FNDCF1]|uniref:biliverdin-producing heme oxygenase n=1 Tax=Komagataeibacter sp. FNDCF1 TaxID=2878681 RepID=UPI001E60FF1A|nr:biliverdin-producing heme oxygenase [Komagataeibacter sp. FNDCF1]MCE2564065.1 biliverdin-producing heme oxygenase [Komagataeibacter sp. FNDCF1]